MEGPRRGGTGIYGVFGRDGVGVIPKASCLGGFGIRERLKGERLPAVGWKIYGEVFPAFICKPVCVRIEARRVKTMAYIGLIHESPARRATPKLSLKINLEKAL